MAEQDYIPSREADFVPWFANFANKLPSYAVPLSIPAADLARVAAAKPFVPTLFDAVEAINQEKKEWVAFKNLVIFGSDNGTNPPIPSPMPPPALSPIAAGLVEFLRGLIGRIKKNVNYTLAIGEDLGIVSSGSAGPAVPKPTGSVSTDGNFTATVKFKKAGFDGVEVWRQRAGETVWVRIATDSYSPYVDNSPPLVAGQPEERRYRLRYLVLDDPTGEYSDVMTIVVGP